MTRIVVAMSGGVDSSVAAALLVRQGCEVIGISMQLWDYSGKRSPEAGRCCAPDDMEDARRVAHRLDIPFYAVNFQKEFRRDVVQPFIRDYVAGRTPSPCVHCNSGLKFHELVRVAARLKASHVATGHYVRLEERQGRFLLRKARDRRKDQSYFLFNLSQEQLARARFPLADLTKSQVRALAADLDLPVAAKRESQELCFLQGEPQGDFIGKQAPGMQLQGEFTDTRGNVLGPHRGIHYYTIGQRRGLRIAAGKPQYVVGIDAEKRIVLLGDGDELMRDTMRVDRINWMAFPRPESEFRAGVRIRYKHIESPATVAPQPDGTCAVRFDEKQRAITPGQAAVFYDDDLVIGGGWIL
jgi:tRNA-specific 2-thiouridylase